MLGLLQSAAPPGSPSASNLAPSHGSESYGPVHVTLSQLAESSEYLISLHKSFEATLLRGLEGLRHDQDRREQSLKLFIQEEFQLLSSGIKYDMRAYTAELKEGLKELYGPDERPDGPMEETLGKVDVNLLAAYDIGEESSIMRRGVTQSMTPEVWKQFEEVQGDVDIHCLYKSVLQRKTTKKSVWHHVLDGSGCSGWVRKDMPHTCLARLTEHPVFIAFQTLLIFANTCLIGYDADASIKAALQSPRGEAPRWIRTCGSIFNVAFLAELLLRIIALRSWFFVAPGDWAWNLFDVCLVLTSVGSDLLIGINLSFIRTLRVLRAVRVARIIRMFRFFRNLRRMLFAILACLSSLAWAFVFLFLMMFMFSILFVQGSVYFLEGPENDGSATLEIELWFGSLTDAMYSLLAAVTGGADWLEIRKPLVHAGSFYAVTFVFYMLFVTVGVMNVLTGVFLTNANEFVDMSLIVHSEEARVDAFVEQLLELFHALDISHTGEVDWPTFNHVLRDDRVRAYFSSLELEPTHVRLIFNLLDQHGVGKITIDDLVMGMVRLKGEAKAIDARIIQRELSMFPLFFQNFTEYLTSKLFTPGDPVKNTTTDM